MAEISQNSYMQYPYSYQQPFNGYNVPSKGLEDIKNQENVAGKVVDTFDPTEKPSSKIRNFLYSLLASTGVVRLTNWALQPKNISEDMKVIDTFTNSRMYKVGQKIDNLKPLKWISEKCGAMKNRLSSIPLPEFIKDFGRQYKIGSVSTWDSQGMYTLGKQSEAMQEFIKFFSEVSKETIDKLALSTKNKELIYKLAKQVNLGKVNHIDAFKQLEPIIKNLSAASLKEISPKVGSLSKMLGATKDLNLSFAKTQALSGNTASGPVGKLFNKLSTLTGEASGGGVLGGKMALFLNAFGLMTAVNAASNAEKGDKIKAFMENYLAYTIGGYLMGMVVGKVFNHALGYAEFGMNIERAKGVGKTLGISGVKRVQDVVIGYNKEFAKNKTLTKYLEKLNKGKVVVDDGTLFGGIKRLFTRQITTKEINDFLTKHDIPVNGTDLNALKDAVSKNIKSVTDMTKMRRIIEKTMKSNITLKSVFKGKEGTFMNRLGKWIVQKPVAKLAKWMSFGKYTLRKPNGWAIGNFFRRFKMIGGGISRMIFVGIVLTEPFQKLFAKMSHSIFGKPKKSEFDEKKEEQKPQSDSQAQKINDSAEGYVPFSNQSKSLYELYTGKPKTVNSPTTTQPVTNNFINNTTDKKDVGNIDNANYIPNQILTPESFVDVNLTEDLLKRRDMALCNASKAEQAAIDLLSRL